MLSINTLDRPIHKTFAPVHWLSNISKFLEDDETVNITSKSSRFEDMIVFRKTRRTSTFSLPAKRSKYIAIPNQVVQVGNHFIHKFQQGREVNVPPDIGFLHHYRSNCIINNKNVKFKKCQNIPTEVDRTMYTHKKKLIERMDKVFVALSQQCNLS